MVGLTDPVPLFVLERDPAVAEFFRLITEKAQDAACAAGASWAKEHPSAHIQAYTIDGRLAEEQAAYDSVLYDTESGFKSESEAVRTISARLHWQIKAMSPQELSTHLQGTSGRVPYITLEAELQEQPPLPQFEPDEIAETLAEANSVEFSSLVTGIDRAQKVLPGSYLFVLWATRLTHSGCSAQIVRMTPFLTAHAAQKFATEAVNEWIAAGAQTEPMEIGYRPQIAARRVPIISYASVQYDSSRLRDSKQVTAIVLGPFPTAIVGFELVNAFSAPIESEALRQFFLAVNDDRYSRIDTTICYAQDHPRRDYWGLEQGVYWHDDHIGDIVPESRFTGEDDAAGLTPPSVPVPMRIRRREEADILGTSSVPAARQCSSWLKAQLNWNTGIYNENDRVEWFENTQVTRLQGNNPIRWTDVEPFPAIAESSSPENSDHGF